MEKYAVLIQEANKHYNNADHMVYMTYPLVNDPKLIIAIAENLYKALMNAVDAVIEYEYTYKRIDRLPTTFEEKIEEFKEISRTYNFERSIILILKELKALIDFRQKSPIEFIRKSNFVICDKNYSTRMINLKKMKENIAEVKPFLTKANGVLRKNGL